MFFGFLTRCFTFSSSDPNRLSVKNTPSRSHPHYSTAEATDPAMPWPWPWLLVGLVEQSAAEHGALCPDTRPCGVIPCVYATLNRILGTYPQAPVLQEAFRQVRMLIIWDHLGLFKLNWNVGETGTTGASSLETGCCSGKPLNPLLQGGRVQWT